jgi:hypothetical protein
LGRWVLTIPPRDPFSWCSRQAASKLIRDREDSRRRRFVRIKTIFGTRDLSDSGSLYFGVTSIKGSFGQIYVSDQSLTAMKNAYLSESEQYLARERTGFNEL